MPGMAAAAPTARLDCRNRRRDSWGSLASSVFTLVSFRGGSGSVGVEYSGESSSGAEELVDQDRVGAQPIWGGAVHGPAPDHHLDPIGDVKGHAQVLFHQHDGQTGLAQA